MAPLAMILEDSFLGGWVNRNISKRQFFSWLDKSRTISEIQAVTPAFHI